MVASAPVPKDEDARLEALHSFAILDTPPEERFNLFTKMASWLFRAPVAAINFVDAERTFFKATIGLTPYSPVRRTSICAHAVGNGDPVMIVQDMKQDLRFDDHPLVKELGLQFYAGALVRSPTGHALGTLCVCDTKPRPFSADEQRQLSEMAGGVGEVLQLHLKTVQLYRSSVTDPLTGLYNRRMFTDALHAAVACATTDRPCLLLYLDLDRFKNVNDQFGHAAGDALLIEVGRRLKRTVRAGDIVARLGGDEFVVLGSGAVASNLPEVLAARILAAFGEPFHFNGNCLEISGSIGIARCPHNGEGSTDILLRCADVALYRAKQEGRNQYRVYEADGACLAA